MCISAQETLDAMAQVEPTPGPWMIFEGGDIGSAAVRLPQNVVLKAGSVKGETIAVAMSNARLITIAPEMRDLLNAVLIFHAGGEWTREKQEAWTRATGHAEATSRILCDAIREVLGRGRPDFGPNARAASKE